MEQRRREGRCFHCGQESHRVRDCKTDLNKKKTKNDAQVSSARAEKEEEKEDVDTGSSDSEDSGKE